MTGTKPTTARSIAILPVTVRACCLAQQCANRFRTVFADATRNRLTLRHSVFDRYQLFRRAQGAWQQRKEQSTASPLRADDHEEEEKEDADLI